MIEFPEGLEPVRDLTPAAWVEAALKEWPSRPFLVRDLVPPVFEAYARILHRTQIADRDGLRTGTWAQRAGELGRDLDPETKWWDLIGTAPYEGAGDPWTPEEGRLSESEAGTLVSVLAPATSDPAACWFALWAGWGFLGEKSTGYLYPMRPGPIAEWRMRRRAEARARREHKAMARLSTFELLGRSGRSYLLFRGALGDASRFTFDGWFQSPTLWWPEDRSWFVHTEIDGMSTHLGGSRRLVDRLVGEQVLESFEVEAHSSAAL